MRMRLVVLPVALAALTAEANGQAPQQWSVVEELRIGALDTIAGPGSEVSGLVVGPLGQLVLLDSWNKQIVMFDAEGQFVTTVGRGAKVPSPFQSVSAAGFLHDTLWVSDGTGRETTLFSAPDFRSRRLPLATPASAPFSAAGVRAISKSGLALAQPRIRPEAIPTSAVHASPIIRLARDNSVVDSVAMLSIGHPFTSTEGGGVFLYSPFNDGALWQGHPHGDGITIVERKVARSDTDGSFTIRRMDHRGTITLDKRVAYAPIPVSTALADSVVEAGAKALRSDARLAGVDLPAMLRKTMFLPSFMPPVAALVAGLDGTTWVERERVRQGQSQWQVFDEKGILVGELVMPRSVEIAQADRRFIWAIDRSRPNAPSVVRFRLIHEAKTLRD